VKSLFITVLLLAGAFLAYDFFLVPPHQRMIFAKSTAPSPRKTAPLPPPTTPPASTQTPTASTPPPATQPSPSSSSDFIPPAVASVEEVTQNWTQIPARAFPRPVILKQAVAIKMAAGSGQLAAGTSAIALSAEQGILTITPAQGSSARGSTPVTATDFPDQIQSAYETWKAHRIDLARKSWEARRQTASAGPAVATADQLDPSGKPIANSDGSYGLLLTSMANGQVNEITPKKILRWGQPRAGQVDGQPGWLIDVEFNTMTLFGPFDVQAQAQILNGRLVRWIYTGSGEEVP
jgi:hypothetical protein